jgi:redox-sensing transcriptional repressor
MNEVKQKISPCIMQRLARYYLYIQRLDSQGIEWVSSQEVAAELELTSSTVRQDISHLDFSGISKRGYEVGKLKRILCGVLGLDRLTPTVIVGAGNFGRALLLHRNFRENGFEIKAIFDKDPKLIGKNIESYYIQDIKNLIEVVREHKAKIGVIAVPSAAAQETADNLARAGITGILNLSTADIQVPRGCVLVNSRILLDFIRLAFYINR